MKDGKPVTSLPTLTGRRVSEKLSSPGLLYVTGLNCQGDILWTRLPLDTSSPAPSTSTTPRSRPHPHP
ncbi:hypothetical protein D9758_016159 [Tetrapyrgos nigripes]|uniref:Uncharacterized protein n=1 Tax=Tetrapyrgos nigripes TaxID=182062 RepID=A0A8H5CC70_9AGAR|nr:hypothetical protein D9758_016159 [Tetrapyrgos nigripes]